MPEETTVYLNGIDATTGNYLVDPMPLDDLVAMVKGEPKDQKKKKWLAKIWHKISTPFMGLPIGVEPSDVTQAGWGIVFLKDENPAVKAVMQPLIDHRLQQIKDESLVKVLEYEEGQRWEEWLAKYQVAPGSVQPRKIPYYLLLVGDPRRIPFTFGHQLDVEYGVGWLHFDTPAEYSAYVASLIDYETSASVPNSKEAVFFGTRHPFDQATKMSADLLVNPLADGLPASGTDPAAPGVPAQFGYSMRKIWGNDAKKAALMDVICQGNGGKPPAFLFTASHGIGFPKGHPDQHKSQGALVCQDWPGFGSINATHYFSAADVPDEGRVQGMVIFHFACYGAGTPDRDLFIHESGRQPAVISDSPFLASLPKKWLTHPKGGALACIGHIERAWGYSIVAPAAGPQIQTFQNTIGRILIGQPLGYALKDFNERYAALSTSLSSTLEKSGWGQKIDPVELTTCWVQRNDAQGYILIGDPAVQLRAGDLS